MARKTHKGYFKPKNPEKLTSSKQITYRSSWELALMRVLDEHPNVKQWCSEGVQIPYKNPLTGRFTVYIPDFLVKYVDKDGNETVEMIEVKPAKEVPGYQKLSEKTGKPLKVSARDKAAQIVNAAKWQAAMAFCAKRNIKFRVATEDILFAYKRKP
jgi:hypothetical protein